jgi:phosphomevalonate kinase
VRGPTTLGAAQKAKLAVVSGSPNWVVSAPGKLMVIGEYAVLEGAEAVVAAVDRRAYARLRGASAPAAPAEARAAFARVERSLGPLGAEPGVDVSSLRSQGSKLGLGSSAAAAAASAGLALALHGRELVSREAHDAVFDAAFQGHRDIAPQGSGADVAASVYGGFIRFRRRGDTADVAPIDWPTGLRIQVVWTGQEARTSTFLERVAALAVSNPALHRECFDTLAGEAQRFVRALGSQDVGGVLASTAAYGLAMGELGKAAGVPIVTDVLQKVANLAQEAGGASKPSGAGGGDVALAVFPDDKSEQRFAALCREYNFTLLLIELGAPGVRLESVTQQGEATE